MSDVDVLQYGQGMVLKIERLASIERIRWDESIECMRTY